MKPMLFCLCFLVAGCGTVATTEVKPSTSSVKSKTEEKRPTETHTTRMTVTTTPAQSQTYRLKIESKKELPCEKLSTVLPQQSSPVQQ